MASAVIILADGFEEIEAISVIDILRRGGVEVIVAGLDKEDVCGAHQIKVNTDTTIDQLTENYDAIILPGGEPGTTNLENSTRLSALLKSYVEKGNWVCAICAAPRILDGLGILNGKMATSYPSVKDKMTQCQYSENQVVIDGQVITSRGPGAAMLFGYTILEKLTDADVSKTLKEKMLF